MQKAPTIQWKLVQYSTLSFAFLGSLSSSKAQIIYHDVDPDDTLNVLVDGQHPHDVYLLDLNNDGITDFKLAADSVGIDGLNEAMIGAQTNSMLGVYSTGIEPLINAYKLNAYDYIGPSGHWMVPDLVNGPFELGGNLLLNYSSTTAGDYGFWKGGVVNGFVGLRFHSNGNNYYGWLRLDVADDASWIIIKDYGYNAIPDSGILAKQGSASLAPALNNVSQISVFPNPAFDKIFISGLSNQKCEASIYDLEGRLLFTRTMDFATHSDINISFLPSGDYFLQLKSDQGISKKMFAVSR